MVVVANGRCLALLLVICGSSVAWAKEPLGTHILTSVIENKEAPTFAGLVRSSDLSWKDFDSAYVSFLAPRDSDCGVTEVARLRGLKTKDDARVYVLDHAFKGQLNVMPGSDEDSKLTAYYFPAAGTMDVLRERVTIDENHPFSLPLLSGRVVQISISKDGALVGARSKILYKNNGAQNGDEFELDECAVF
jgi:hypothetical protein